MKELAHDQRNTDVSAEVALDAKRHMGREFSRQVRGARRRGLQCDLAARIRSADHENRAVPQLGGISILARVELDDARIELGSKARHARKLVARHRHDHVSGLEFAAGGGDKEIALLLP